MSAYCAFCGRRADECPGGLWNITLGVPRRPRDIGICLYCARAAVRAFGETPDPGSAVVPLRQTP